ncbi:hypothetical protein L3Y34_016256 [Caenorhabditis briggsae]|uniref:Zap1-like C2H2 zinc finger 1 domain-containing protein n=1 Tax=Caenorhabditis briggsae TaxID=6238 RepID=A0AAE9DYN3_CAEBR|nr:hypothetical protein L3Y34_016256 [Caenorhabditis briggsae]
MASSSSSGPLPDMIQCGWKDCNSWFSTGIDMNQHVAINHLKFMKIQFQEADQAILEPKRAETSEVHRSSIMPVRVFQQPWTRNSYGTPQKSHHRNLVADQEDRKPYHYFNIVEDEDDEAPPSTDPSEISQTPEEPSNRKRSREEDEEGNGGDDDVSIVSETSEASSSKKKQKTSSSTGNPPEKLPWSLAQDMSHIPSREVRLSTPFTTIADMAYAIREELNCRKTLRKRNQANGNYCVVCLDYRKDSGFCDYMHNNQHDHFIKYWHAMFGTERVNKQNLLLQFQEMMKVRDVLPKLSTAYYQGSR